ncbi:type IV secretory system conjugative DNA transfer family protein [Thermoactinomyces daqus]|uniref:Type IV secretory system conjugative DNA transfer family protein n=1 Tax=Thermoactinomyces daqus TaxID=1329516 RepID=A0A7W1XCV4_9BACL|nr:type IV secretory system conjugative DNA transfer family protein [Thermoactinomyces daqus]MBA4544286.1 type IV secretory system conjugative DNA transfer family protein [Thermoactinomyces daqus]
MFKLVKVPFKALDVVNARMAKGFNWLVKKEKLQHRDPYGIARAFFHGSFVIGMPYLVAQANGYELGPFGVPVWIGGAVYTYRAWRDVYKTKKEADTYGDARFLEFHELKKAGLIGKTGLLLGKMKGKFISKPETMEGHVIVIGPPGSGKTSGFVIPSLWVWQDSALVFDPKGGELSEKTAVYRSRFQKVYVFNPFAEKCDQYNPLDFCHTTDEALSMAEILIPQENKANAYWEEMARSIVAAAIYEGHLKHRTLTEVCKFICSNDIGELKEYYLNHPNEKVRLLASPLRHLEDKVQSYVMSDLMRSLNKIAADDNIKRATSQSDWDLNELESRATIYLSVPEEKLKLPQYRKLMNIIINQAVDHLSARKEVKKNDKRPRILFMIDELPTLGHIPSLLQSLATLRSRGVVLSLAFQAMSQLDDIYQVNGRKTIMNICPFKLVFGIDEPETQRYFSDRAGTKTIKTESINRSEDREGYERVSISESETGVPLIHPNDWSDLQKKPVLFTTSKHPARLEIIEYWKDFQLNQIMRRKLKEVVKQRQRKEIIVDHMKEIVGDITPQENERREAN